MSVKLKSTQVILIGYSGHALVVAEALILSGYKIFGYLEKEKAENNQLGIDYLGFERDQRVINSIIGKSLFPAIGNNYNREIVFNYFEKDSFTFIKAIHPNSNISNYCNIGSGSIVCRGANINPYVNIGKGVIINTGAIVEHECFIGDFVHVAPGTVLAGNVKIGKGSFIGANAVIKQGIEIGENVTIGAGSVVLQNMDSNTIAYGNPAKSIVKLPD